MSDTPKPKGRRGFASMDPELQRQIAAKGGRSAHARGKAHTFSAEEARVAGAQGGLKVSANREHMAAIGRRGGLARKGRRKSVPEPVVDGSGAA